MITLSVLGIILNTKDYCQIATNIFQKYTDKWFKKKFF